MLAFDAAGKVLWEYAAGDEITETAVYGGASAYRALAGTRDSRVVLLDANGQALWERRLNFAIRGLGVTPTPMVDIWSSCTPALRRNERSRFV